MLKRSLFGDAGTVKLLEASGLLRRVVQNNDIEVVFIFNRELDQQLQVEHIDTEKEATNRSELENATRSLWKKMLSKANKQLLKANESSRTESEIDEIVQNTQCRTIYPMTQHGLQSDDEPARKQSEWTNRIIWDRVFGGRMDDREHVKSVFEQHNAAVVDEVPAENLLVYTPGDGWAPLCRFLGVEIPEEPYPRVNSREEFGSIFGPRDGPAS